MYQKVSATGFLGREPETRAGNDGTPVTTFSLGVNRHWTTATGEPQEKSIWLMVSAWGKLAELAASLKRGDPINLEGWVEPVAWMDHKENQPRARLDLTATALRFVGTRADPGQGHGITQFVQALVVGHLGKDPESRSTPSSVPITSFSVATSRRNGGDEKPVWFRVTCWRKLADLTAQYLRKGRLALVDGDLDVSAWIDRDGNPQATLELSAVNVRFLGGRSENSTSLTAPAAEETPTGGADEIQW